MHSRRSSATLLGLIALVSSLLLVLSPRLGAQPVSEDAALQDFFQAMLRADTNGALQILRANTNLARVPASRYHDKLPLLVAASKGQLEIVDQLLKLGADVNAEGDTWDTANHRATALEISIWYNHPAVCKRLLEARPSLNHRTTFNGGALHLAFAHRRNEMAGWLLDHGANPFLLGGYPTQLQTPFALHIKQGDGKLVPRMIEVAGPAATDFLRTNGPALLRFAATRGQLVAVEALLAAGVSPQITATNEPPLLQAVAVAALANPIAFMEIRDLLRHRGADYDVFAVTGFGDLETARQLVRTNQNLPVARDNEGATPLHWAVRADRPALTEFWLASGAALGATNFAGQTPAHLAAAAGLTKQLDLLLAANPPLDLRDTNGWTPLDAAMQAKQTETIRMLMASSRVTVPTDRGIAISLHEAAARGNIVALTALTRATNVNARNELGLTPFLLAMQNGQLGAAAFLLDQGADVNARDPEGNTALHHVVGNWSFSIRGRPSANWLARRNQNLRQAAYLRFLTAGANDEDWPRQSLPAIGFLLACGADASMTNQAGQTPMQLLMDSKTVAFESERGEILKLFGVAGENIDQRDAAGNTALHRAMQAVDANELDALVALIDGGAAVNATNAGGQTPLHLAVTRIYSWGMEDSATSPVQALIRAKANVNAQDREGQTPLHVLARSETAFQKEAAQALLTAGANPNLRDKSGRTPAHIFLSQEWPWSGAQDCLPLLAAAEADLSARDPQGRTPLHYYAALAGPRGNLLFFTGELPDTFTAAAVDFNAQDQRGDTPLHLAARQGGKDIFEWLCRAGAKLDVTNRAGETPRWLALQHADPFNRFQVPATEDIHEAARTGDLATLRRLLQTEPRLMTITNQAGETPVRLAARTRQTNAVEILLAAGASWDEVSAAMLGRAAVLEQILRERRAAVRTVAYGQPLLHHAAKSGSVASVETVLTAGATLEAVDHSGLSVLGAALQNDQSDVVTFLRSRGASENIFDSIILNQPELIRRLLSQPTFSPTVTNGVGLTALHVAVVFGRTEVLAALLARPISPNLPAAVLRQSAISALHVAAACNRTNEAALLLANGANAVATDNSGCQPLHYAAATGAAEVIAQLLAHGVSPDVPVTVVNPVRSGPRTWGGTPALHLAAVGQHTNAITVLLAGGANVNATNSLGVTPLGLVLWGGTGGHNLGYLQSNMPGWALGLSLRQMGFSNVISMLTPFGRPVGTRAVISQLENAGAWKPPEAEPALPGRQQRPP